MGGHDLSRFGGLFLIIWSDCFTGSMNFSQAAGSGKLFFYQAVFRFRPGRFFIVSFRFCIFTIAIVNAGDIHIGPGIIVAGLESGKSLGFLTTLYISGGQIVAVAGVFRVQRESFLETGHRQVVTPLE